MEEIRNNVTRHFVEFLTRTEYRDFTSYCLFEVEERDIPINVPSYADAYRFFSVDILSHEEVEDCIHNSSLDRYGYNFSPWCYKALGVVDSIESLEVFIDKYHTWLRKGSNDRKLEIMLKNVEEPLKCGKRLAILEPEWTYVLLKEDETYTLVPRLHRHI